MLEKKENKIEFDSARFKINDEYNEELRISNYKVMNLFANTTNLLVNGSADLFSSCKNLVDSSPIMTDKSITGRNIRFGVREHAMGAILNGMALSGLKCVGSTFLTFADYVKPAMRMSALQNLPVTYVFTHDSITVGQDGPTHEPIEQLAMLRAIPNFYTYRPADIVELMGCWESILKRNKASALVISKDKQIKIPNSDSKQALNGAYIVRPCGTNPDVVLISSGHVVKDAYIIANKLATNGINANVVSVPCLKLFLEQNSEYRNRIIPENTKRIVIEDSSAISLGILATSPDYIVGLDDFGFSGTKDEVEKTMEFDINSLILKVEKLAKW